MAEVNIDVAKEASVQGVNTTVGTVNTSVQAVNTKVGTSGDTASSTPTTLFAGIKGLIAWFTGTWTAVRAGYVDTINTNTATNNTASKTGTLSQKESYGISLLENSTYGLSALKTALTGGSVRVVKSVQRGTITLTSTSSTSANISAVNTSKSVLNYLGMTTLMDSTRVLIQLALTNSTTVTAKTNGATETYPSTVSFEVIEYY